MEFSTRSEIPGKKDVSTLVCVWTKLENISAWRGQQLTGVFILSVNARLSVM